MLRWERKDEHEALVMLHCSFPLITSFFSNTRSSIINCSPKYALLIASGLSGHQRWAWSSTKHFLTTTGATLLPSPPWPGGPISATPGSSTGSHQSRKKRRLPFPTPLGRQPISCAGIIPISSLQAGQLPENHFMPVSSSPSLSDNKDQIAILSLSGQTYKFFLP